MRRIGPTLVLLVTGWLGLSAAWTAAWAQASPQSHKLIRVAYAGSMGTVLDTALGPAFARANGVEYQGIGQGAYGLARLLTSGQIQAEVFISITPGPMQIVE